MSAREPFVPEEREPDVIGYDVAPADMPPAPAGAGAEDGGEAAASRRLAGRPEGMIEEPSDQPEPFLGYDGMSLDDLLEWIEEEAPGPGELREIIEYEETHRRRDSVIDQCRDRLGRWLDDG